MAKLTSEASETFAQAILPDSRTAISSPASESGRTLSPKASVLAEAHGKVGRKISAAGRDRARASLSLFPENEKAHPMSATCGRHGLNSSRSRALSESLASR